MLSPPRHQHVCALIKMVSSIVEHCSEIVLEATQCNGSKSSTMFNTYKTHPHACIFLHACICICYKMKHLSYGCGLWVLDMVMLVIWFHLYITWTHLILYHVQSELYHSPFHRNFGLTVNDTVNDDKQIVQLLHTLCLPWTHSTNLHITDIILLYYRDSSSSCSITCSYLPYSSDCWDCGDCGNRIMFKTLQLWW